jgi:hypothetical protein
MNGLATDFVGDFIELQAPVHTSEREPSWRTHARGLVRAVTSGIDGSFLWFWLQNGDEVVQVSTMSNYGEPCRIIIVTKGSQT